MRSQQFLCIYQPGVQIIRIFNRSEVRIENSVTRVTVRHHESGQIEPNDHYRFIFLHTLPSTIAVKIYIVKKKKKKKKKNYIFRPRNVRFGSSPIHWRRNVWLKNDVNMTSRCQKWRGNVKIVILTSCTRVVLQPLSKTTFRSPGRVHRNTGRVCKKRIS